MPEEIGVILVFLLVGGVFALIIWLAVVQQRRMGENLQSIGAKYDGRVESSFWSGSRLDMAVDGLAARLNFFGGGKNNPPWTRIQFQWRPSGTLRIVPEGFWAGVRKAFGAEDIQIGDAAFDAGFLVQGAPVAWVREVVGPELRRRLVAQSQVGAGFWTGGSGVRLEAGPSGVTVFVQRNLVRDQALLAAFVENAVAILRAMRGTISRGEIELSSMKVEAGRCPVCAHPVDAGERRCGTCRTPHHAECWDFFGGCAIYGCGTRVTAS